MIRFQVAQPLLAGHDAGYRSEVRNAVTMARRDGFAVILSMQDQAPSGERDPLGMPDTATASAWAFLTPMLRSDCGIIAELFNEPQPQPSPSNWDIWQNGGAFGGRATVGHQQLVNQLRRAGVRNVIVADGLALGKSFAGAPPLSDPAGQLAYGTHPYFGPVNGQPDDNPAAWQRNFGFLAATRPVIATEWDENGYGPPSCMPAIPSQASQLVRFLRARRIGLTGFAFDVIGTLIRDWDYTPTSYAGFTCGQPSYGPGQLIHGYFYFASPPSRR